MCVIIDINCLSPVFNEEDPSHNDFKPVNEWIYNRNGKIVVGGTKYFEELSKAKKYLRIVAELSRRRKVVKLDDVEVDKHQEEVENLLNDEKCDDPHLIALVRVSRVKVLCTKEERAIPFLKRSELYRKSTDRPKIYRKAIHSKLLIDSNIAGCCK